MDTPAFMAANTWGPRCSMRIHDRLAVYGTLLVTRQRAYPNQMGASTEHRSSHIMTEENGQTEQNETHMWQWYANAYMDMESGIRQWVSVRNQLNLGL